MSFPGTAAEPKVGIFWLSDGNLVIDSTLLSKAEDYGGAFKIHPGDHCSVWEKVSARRNRSCRMSTTAWITRGEAAPSRDGTQGSSPDALNSFAGRRKPGRYLPAKGRKSELLQKVRKSLYFSLV